MVRHLLAAGYAVAVFARRPEIFDGEAAEIIAAGATVCQTLESLAQSADLLILNVIATEDVEALCLGQAGLFAHARRGTIVMDHSTIDPERTMQLALIAQQGGLEFVDAPVSGGVWAAEAGTLLTLLGGSETAVSAVLPVLSQYTKHQQHIGPAGHGQIAKLCNQIAQVVTIQGIAESIHFARALGGDPDRVLHAIVDGMGGSPMMRLLGPKMVAGDFQAGIQLRLHAKDAKLAADAASRAGTTLPATELVSAHYQQLLDRQLGEHDTASLIRLLEDLRS